MKILILPGDGIGPEIIAATEAVLRHADAKFQLGLEISHRAVGFDGLKAEGSTLSDDVLAAARSADGVILGPCDTAAYPPPSEGGVGTSAVIRKELDLYANIRPSRAFASVPALAPDMDLVLVRENTEGFYADRNMFEGSGEFMPTADVALAVRKITAEGCRRIARAGLELAARRRKRITFVHKANVLKLSDGLFLKMAEAEAKAFPDVEVEDRHVDAIASDLVEMPGHFDVIVTTNMFGDILSNLAASLSGGIGLGGSINMGEEHGVAQAAHGSAPDIAGKGIANPTAMIASTVMLLEWLGRSHNAEQFAEAGRAVQQALDKVLADSGNATADLGGNVATTDFADAVSRALD